MTLAATAQALFELGKDKFSRKVLQSLEEAANTSNVKDLIYLVNYGESIVIVQLWDKPKFNRLFSLEKVNMKNKIH